MAEYEACIMGLEKAMNLRIKSLDVFEDSALVVNQIKGEWETNQPGLIPYRDYVRMISTFFTKVEFHHIPRDENQMADALATLASMIMVKFWKRRYDRLAKEKADMEAAYEREIKKLCTSRLPASRAFRDP